MATFEPLPKSMLSRWTGRQGTWVGGTHTSMPARLKSCSCLFIRFYHDGDHDHYHDYHHDNDNYHPHYKHHCHHKLLSSWNMHTPMLWHHHHDNDHPIINIIEIMNWYSAEICTRSRCDRLEHRPGLELWTKYVFPHFVQYIFLPWNMIVLILYDEDWWQWWVKW